MIHLINIDVHVELANITTSEYGPKLLKHKTTPPATLILFVSFFPFFTFVCFLCDLCSENPTPIYFNPSYRILNSYQLCLSVSDTAALVLFPFLAFCHIKGHVSLYQSTLPYDLPSGFWLLWTSEVSVRWIPLEIREVKKKKGNGFGKGFSFISPSRRSQK